jgi:hypothetical protein
MQRQKKRTIRALSAGPGTLLPPSTCRLAENAGAKNTRPQLRPPRSRGNGGRNCHGGDVDACPLDTLKSAERQRSDTRLADAEGDELRIWLPHRSVSLGSNQPTRGRVWRRYWPSDPATVAPSSSAVATMASNKHSSFIMSRTRYRRLNAGDSPASHRWF